jgi:hypothetical protein
MIQNIHNYAAPALLQDQEKEPAPKENDYDEE